MRDDNDPERWVRQAMHHYYGRDAEALTQLVRQLAQRLPPPPASPCPFPLPPVQGPTP